MALVPGIAFEKMIEHSIDFWLQCEGLPRPDNRIYYDGDKVVLDIHEGNMEAASRLPAKLEGLLLPLGGFSRLIAIIANALRVADAINGRLGA